MQLINFKMQGIKLMKFREDLGDDSKEGNMQVTFMRMKKMKRMILRYEKR